MSDDMRMTRVPPQSLDAESAVLGAMMLDRDQIAVVIELLRKEDFYKEANGLIFESIIEIYDQNEPVDLVTMISHLTDRTLLEKVGGAGYLSTLVESVPSTTSAPNYARIVREKSTLRKLIHAGSNIMDWGYQADIEVDEVVARAEKSVYDVSKSYAVSDILPMKTAVKNTFKIINDKYQERGGGSGLRSGYPDLDDKTTGFQPSDLIILAARPSMGKTSLALNIAENIALNDEKAVGVFSLEMAAEQLVTRLLCSNARVDASALRKGFLTERDWVSITKSMDRLSRTPIYIVDAPGISSLELRAKARRMRKEHDVQFIVIDYLQLMRTEGRRSENRVQEVSDLTRDMKLLARELNVPVLVLSQLSRAVEKRDVKRPQLSDLRESGSIEQDADVVMFIYREDYYRIMTDEGEEEPVRAESEPAEIIIAKQRNGPTGRVKLTFQHSFARFENYTAREAYT